MGILCFVGVFIMSIDRWSIISEMCQAEGVELFDLEQSGNILRAYIHHPDGIQHAHCAGVSNRILNHTEVEKILPGSMLLEVSSPGVNRKLTRPEHFQGAVGERVKISYRHEDGKKISIIGLLKKVDGERLVVETSQEKKKLVEEISIPRQSVVDSRVDFLFK